MLTKVNEKVEKGNAELTQQNNDLKEAINKYKNGKQLCFDICLLITFLLLLGFFIKLCEFKGILPEVL